MGGSISVDFAYTGAEQIWVVPPFTSAINVEVRGASGGSAAGQSGGGGGYTAGKIPVNPGDILYIYVGGSGSGSSNAAGGFNGGGRGAPYSSGGGASDIRLNGNTPSHRIVVAGGGGGSGNRGGGTALSGGGAGGGGNNPGGRGLGSYGGYGGANGVGGARGDGGSGGNATNGGTGYRQGAAWAAGGGGGGYGGGGGGAQPGTSSTGGGGGGGGYIIPEATNVVGIDGENRGHGYIRIEYEYEEFFLFEDNGEVKTYDPVEGFKTIGTVPADINMFREHGIPILSDIPDEQLEHISADATLLTYSTLDRSHLVLEAEAKPQIILANSDIDIGMIEHINKVNVTSSPNIKIIISKNRGLAWNTFKNHEWIQVQLNPENVKANGLSPAEIEEITPAQWKQFIGPYPQTIRFGYYIEDTEYVDDIAMEFNMFGEWEGTPIETDYTAKMYNRSIQVNLLSSGTFKINY